MRETGKWHLIWHCLDCLALVGCHEGTDIPLGLMADVSTRAARFEAHKAFDRLWLARNARMTRKQAYIWMATTLGLPEDRAHISMMTEEQCASLILAVLQYKHNKQHPRHWTQDKRKKRRK